MTIPVARQREKRQTPTIDATNIQGMTPPLLVGIPLFILSAMFIASMWRNREKPEVVEEVAEIIVGTPPTFTTLTPPHLPAPGQPVGSCVFQCSWVQGVYLMFLSDRGELPAHLSLIECRNEFVTKMRFSYKVVILQLYENSWQLYEKCHVTFSPLNTRRHVHTI